MPGDGIVGPGSVASQTSTPITAEPTSVRCWMTCNAPSRGHAYSPPEQYAAIWSDSGNRQYARITLSAALILVAKSLTSHMNHNPRDVVDYYGLAALWMNVAGCR